MYLTEGDSWHHRPLHLEVLKYLRAGKRCRRGGLPLGRGLPRPRQRPVPPIWSRPAATCRWSITFVDTDEHVSRVLPKLREMAAHRLIVRENVVIEQGSLD